MAREMSVQEEKYFATKLADDPTLAAFLNNQVNNGQSFMKQAGKLQVCERCESAALADGPGYACVRCGYKSKTRSMPVKDYMRAALFR